VEFNWAQHHRPATFMPADVEIERHEDGSVTVWLSDHEPMSRMKGMHGVCLHPGRAVLEVKARACNRTQLPQTFLWWANVAARVHERYQSFFPPDVSYVADHAKRAMSEFPLCRGSYYGLNYGHRAKNGVPAEEVSGCFVPPGGYAANDLSWYANIPVPTSYMAMGSKEDFFGGYDHAREAGLVHIANHHISPGKKQWTWGNHEFGYAWDRNLTDEDGPYVELMAGVYTDNQPDFSFLAPGETKTWSQYWYPIQKIGPAQQANVRAALSLRLKGKRVCAGVSVTEPCPGAVVRLVGQGKTIAEWPCELAPGKAFTGDADLLPGVKAADLRIALFDGDGNEWIHYALAKATKAEVPPPATEPPSPEEISSNDELYITGLHLEQYRHATRSPKLYWREALRRDPGDARCNNALGLWYLRRGEFLVAETHFRKAIERLTRRNPNPYDGEPYYNLGLVLRHLGRDEEAYNAFYKATWNQAWQAAGFHALAEIDVRSRRLQAAREHLERVLRLNAHNLLARDLLVIVLRRLGEAARANALLKETLALDPLDWWARHLRGDELTCDTQTLLDLALDHARAGLLGEAIALLTQAQRPPEPGAAPLREYYLGWLHEQTGESKAALAHYRRAAQTPRDYCFPARIEEISILQSALRANPKDASALYYLGNLYYDKRRHEDALQCWEASAKIDPGYSVVWRNLGIGYFNVRKQPQKARAAYDKALRANPSDSRVLYERDQLWKRLGESPQKRLREIEKHRTLADRRDDLSTELCALYNQTGQHDKALAILSTRKFQPWEGGEGQALGQHVRTHLALGRRTLAAGNIKEALAQFQQALDVPENLGEARHLLANASDIHYWLGCAHAELGNKAEARKHWTAAAEFRGDFQDMSVRPFSEMTYYSALSLERLGKKTPAQSLLRSLLDYGRALATQPAKIDYFATSLPAMLIFDDDQQTRQTITAHFLQAQAKLGLGRRAEATALLTQVLQRDPNHALAQDFSSISAERKQP
jgi:tetratricopeptide (TPR) repeat protein